MLLLDAKRPGLALGNCALFLGAREGRPGLLFLALMYGKALGQIGFEAAIGVDAGHHLAMLAKPLRGALERTFGGNAFGFEAPDFLVRGLSFAQAIAGICQLMRHLCDRRRIGNLAMTPAALGQFRKLLLQRAEFGEAVGFRCAPMLQIVLGARQRAVAARTALAVREVAPELGVDFIDGAPRAFAADERADFGFDGGGEQRRSAAAGDRRREGRALPDPKKPESAFIDASAAAGADAENVPDGFVGVGEARNLAAVFGQDRRGRPQEALLDDIALAVMLEGELDPSPGAGCRRTPNP
jgi:hypothetical protein